MSNPPLFSIDNIRFYYREVLAIDGITTTIEKGKMYGIIGPNGCGKTTFLDLLTGSKVVATGKINFKEKPISSYSKHELAREVALVPQEFDTGFGYTVEEVVLMGRHPYLERFGSPSGNDWSAVDRAIEDIGIGSLRGRLTNTLSGGQKQRTVVARAFAQNCPVIFFDEATANLDIRYSLQIFNHAKKLVKSENRTIVAVIHDLNFAAAYCDEILFMDQGKIVSQGSPEMILTPTAIGDIFGVDCSVRKSQDSGHLRIDYKFGEN